MTRSRPERWLTGAGEGLRIVDTAAAFGPRFSSLPHVLRILAENVLRHADRADAATSLADLHGWLDRGGASEAEIEFLPSRIMMHDTTCGPALVDIAAMRDCLAEHGIDPRRLTPRLPIDVSTDHSSGVDVFGTKDALARNLEAEFRRNSERYRLMKWAATALPGMRVHPPGSGIMHTINLERLSRVIVSEDGLACPETLIGTDSHTPMINGLGILGWGVGGLEAEGAMFGLPVSLRIPDVTGVRLTGRLAPGTSATDLALTVTEALRALGVTGDFVEFYGHGVSGLPVGTRAAIANMAPEYGASTGFFPVDDETLAYLRLIGRPETDIARIEAVTKAAGLWFDPAAEPVFTRSITLDLDTIAPSVAGPRRPQDRRGAGDTAGAFDPPLRPPGTGIPDGAIAIAAITSCTNTSDQRMLIAAGLLARNAVTAGLKPPGYVKTSLAPGSPTASRMLTRAGLLEPLEAIGFSIVGYGCTTCIGNSGALVPAMAEAIATTGIRAVAVLSGNRNFPGRVHPDLDHGFLASPALVVAFALAGTVNLDITHQPIGNGLQLADLWPSEAEIDAVLARAVDPDDFAAAYDAASANLLWAALDAPEGDRFAWDPGSTYLRAPPFARAGLPRSVTGLARPLLVLGDDITTDHISPANQIRADSETGRYLIGMGEDASDLNVHAARRGNFESMVRGAFTNRLAINRLTPGQPPGMTRLESEGDLIPLTEAARRAAAIGTPLVIVAGERYGMGSSRDWAAKAVALLGVRAVLAASFERIHRTNLIGMGVVPLLLPPGVHPDTLGMMPGDRFDLPLAPAVFAPRARLEARLHRHSDAVERLDLVMAIETSREVDILRSGGMIPHVLNAIIAEKQA